MKSRKFLSLVAVGAMAVSMATNVFATPITDLAAAATGSSVESEGTIKVPTINVVVPTTHGFVLNPYEVQIDGEDAGQVVSTVAKIENKSDVALDVQLKSATTAITSTATSKPTLATTKEIVQAGSNTAKNFYLELVASTTEQFTEGETTKAVPMAAKLAKPVTLGTLDAETGVLHLKYDGALNKKSATGWVAEDSVKVTAVYSFSVNVPTVTE